MRGGCTHSWKRAPIHDRHCRVKGESRKKERHKSSFYFERYILPFTHTGKLSFAFSAFRFMVVCAVFLFIPLGNARYRARTMPFLGKREKYFYRPIHLPWSQTRSLQRHLSRSVFILDLRHESKLYRDTMCLPPAVIREKRFCFSRTNNR